MTQLVFTEYDVIEHDLYIADKCKECQKECKIYSISKDAQIFCKRFKKIKEDK